MSLVSQQFSTDTISSLPAAQGAEAEHLSVEATLSKLLSVSASSPPHSMDRGSAQYPQSGLHSPFSAFTDTSSEDSPADHASAAQYPPQPDLRSHNPNPNQNQNPNPNQNHTQNHNQNHNHNHYPHSASATPTSEYGVYPASARSGSFPGHIQRPYHSSSSHSSGSSGGSMAQSTSPSLPLQDGRPNHQSSQIKSDQDVPIDPSIAASSPTYPPHSGQYSPYHPQQDMQHGYANPPPTGAMYAQPRPDWAGYAGGQHPMHGGYPVSGAQTPTSAAPSGARPGQVYSFVPIPGAQQHKRPRRRYEEIERMYKCGWNGCEKAYGTLNHLNAHVTMQSHGQKRTPEEFKEIRKEWKARKKEEETQRKQEDDRARAAVAPSDQGSDAAPAGYQQPGRSVQLPPIGYQPGAPVPGPYPPAGGVQQLQEYGTNHLQYSGYPASPYGAPNQMYNNQHLGALPAPSIGVLAEMFITFDQTYAFAEDTIVTSYCLSRTLYKDLLGLINFSLAFSSKAWSIWEGDGRLHFVVFSFGGVIQGFRDQVSEDWQAAGFRRQQGPIAFQIFSIPEFFFPSKNLWLHTRESHSSWSEWVVGFACFAGFSMHARNHTPEVIAEGVAEDFGTIIESLK
ncbi:c2h2 transcription factor [Drepanopeziza brunnea f. sp. 'multigermtubi' MB_m1]|uniref:C2h2 transcription factor n=2 Tax=Pezizomycotina TaxID=147538 RepID=K1WBW2_MARBU|nr:c2h2 transcription factor [Drepanopeziza brunnea f. sp. 'multigermtubi' MB_m1]EKD14865.1 c2h2 transcription factor [Drepanopeziza brunnea f. sp. 'multigermtubi' MB_m1]